jgi:hypothetical protein
MKKKIISIFFAVACLLLLLYAYFKESHTVFSLANPDKMSKIDGQAFTETTTFDGLMLRDGKIYDIYTLTPEILQEKDCST